jgi:ABC-type Na+ efflux pump permease subunit
LVAVECRRSLDRGWVLVVRALAAVPPAVVLLTVIWLWWFMAQFEPHFSPGSTLAFGVVAVESMLVTAALLLGQALLAGTLAGDKTHSALALLLATWASPFEIIAARLLGRLCVLCAFVAAGLPPLVWLSAMCSLGPLELAALVVLPLAVGFGGGGLALAVSIVARRGRDALLVVYLVDLVFLLAPLFSTPLSADLRAWIEPLNPFQGIGAVAYRRETSPVLATIVLWSVLGFAGMTTAAWRLRPACLNENGGRRPAFRRGRIPDLDDRPMLWKELYVERAQSLSRFAKWAGILVVVGFSGTSFFLAGLFVWGSIFEPETSASALYQLSGWLQQSWLIGWLLQWALGLRAAAAIASERERGTWDLLLASPLRAREMLWAKFLGSIHVLRWLIAAVVLAWLVGLLCGALEPWEFAQLLVQTALVGFYMVIIGLFFSLCAKSAARATTYTVVSWLVAACVFSALAGILSVILIFVWFFLSLLFGELTPMAGPTFNAWLSYLFHGLRWSMYALTAIFVAGYMLRRFDTLTGRCSEVDSEEA